MSPQRALLLGAGFLFAAKSTAYDIVVIGGGSAGLTAAKFGARFGKRVLLVEKARLGGDCTWTGCVPSKSLLAAAKAAHASRTGSTYGVKSVGEPSVDWAKLTGRLQRTITKIYDEDDSPEALGRLGIEVMGGTARFSGPESLVIASGGGGSSPGGSSSTQVTPKFGVVVATGARPIVPNSIAGLAGVEYLTYEDIFTGLSAQPKAMTVVGGGPIGCELAQAFARLGTEVTLVAEQLLPSEDPEAGAILERVFQREGVKRAKGRAVEAAARGKGGHAVTVQLASGETEVVSGDALLVAVGREAVVEGLGLDVAGVACTDGGDKGIKVDANLQTSNKRVYAAGDCVGGPQFTHVAGFQGAIAARNLLLPLSDRGVLSAAPPACTFTSPEVASVGFTKAASEGGAGGGARRRGPLGRLFGRGNEEGEVATIERKLARVDRAICDLDDPEGLIKIFYRPKDGTILGT